MRRLLFFLAVIATGALLLAGAAVAGRTVSIGQKANGTTVTLQTGDTLRISLPANPSTGYSWKVVFASRTVLRPAGSSYVPRKPVRVGAGGTAVLRFAAVGPGKTRLKLAYVQAGSKQVAKTFTVIVAVG